VLEHGDPPTTPARLGGTQQTGGPGAHNDCVEGVYIPTLLQV
jgi:hypothetical protein